MIALCNYQIKRIENPEAINILYNIINDPKLDITNIKIELLKEIAKKEDFNKIFDKQGNILTKKLTYYSNKYGINKYKINNRQQKYLKQKIYNKKLIELLKNERKLNIILDNARIHTANFTKEMCELLSINLVYLPAYSPDLNPIEPVWRDSKSEIYNSRFNSIKELTKLFETAFYDKVDNTSYYENWANKFFEINFW